ncbi:MAG: ribulose-phosphate 3-epimerase [Chlamydiae bacterium]|nr:ribulose-phosphate 3-epimerase [Chlamydiota bacterium]
MIIAASILAADFAKLGEEAKRAEDAGADHLHIDVMDGHFVKNLTFGPSTVAAMKRSCSLFLDVHLMIYTPYDYIEKFVEAGADQITFHFEATEDVIETIDFIHSYGIKAGLAFCSETSESMIVKYIDKVDNLLLMTVDPGYGGQKFIPEVIDKVRFVRALSDEVVIQVDGGVNLETASESIKAGADALVAGTYIYDHANMKQAIYELRRLGY